MFILSHGRPGNVRTLRTLREQGYTGHYKIVVDDEDPALGEYLDIFGDSVVVFSKEAAAANTDAADNFPGRGTPLFARNAIFDIAKSLGYSFLLQLDDDYTIFRFRGESAGKLIHGTPSDLNALFGVMVNWLESSGVDCVAFAQGGDYIGGAGSWNWKKKVIRKAMNSFFFRADSDVRFVGRLNDDVNTYVTLSHRGKVFLTTLYAMLDQGQTQANAGGLTPEYLDKGTYVKSFYTVMMLPSAARIISMGDGHRRIHHAINWRNVAPKILPEHYRKQGR